MNIALSASFLCVFAAFPCFSDVLPNVLAAPPLPSRLPVAKTRLPVAKSGLAGGSTLSFNVTVRVGANGQYAGPQQTIQARVLLRGSAARIESSSGGTPSVVLFSSPYIYRLLPESKAGVRWKIDAKKPSNFSDFDPQQLLRDPSKIKSALLLGGAKKTGSGILTSTSVDIYQAQNFGRQGQMAKVWLRRSDSLPLRLEASGGQLKIAASWKNYARPSLSASLFGAPPGFKVRNLAGSPPFSFF